MACPKENGDVSFGDGCGDILPSIVMLSGTVVVPASLILWQISAPRGDVRLGDGIDEQGGSEHIFIFLMQGLGVISEVKDERTHQCASLFGNLLGAKFDVG